MRNDEGVTMGEFLGSLVRASINSLDEFILVTDLSHLTMADSLEGNSKQM